MRRVIVVPAVGNVTVKWLPGDEDAATRIIHGLIDGYLEFVATPHDDIAMFANEDGKRMDLPINPRATMISHPAPSKVMFMNSSECIVGTVVIVGKADQHGNFTSAPQEWIDAPWEMEHGSFEV